MLERLAALVPPPRVHRHRYYGVPAPNAPLRQAVTAMATPPAHAAPLSNPPPAQPPLRRQARYASAQLLARIREVFPLLCPLCATEMRIVGFITDPRTVRTLLTHLGEPIRPSAIAPARGPPLWDIPETTRGPLDPEAQPAPAYEFDQRIAWQSPHARLVRMPRACDVPAPIPHCLPA